MKKTVFITAFIFLSVVFPALAAEKTTLQISASTPSASSVERPGVFWGAFLGGVVSPAAAAIYDKTNGRKMASVMWFLDWNSNFPLTQCSELSAAGYMPHLTWEPWLWSDKSAVNLDRIISGRFDGYIEQFAKDAKSYGKPFFLRVGHEFNGNWYPWAVSANGSNPEKFKAAWIHIYDIFKKTGSRNAQWVWAINNDSVPDAPWNDPVLAYPGDDYVDWLGIDGYNFGTYRSWSGWKSFDEVFSAAYAKLTTKIPGKPVMISEFACADRGGDKAAWLKSLEPALKKYPKIKSVTYFDVNKEMDWRVSSSPETLAAFRYAISSEFYRSDGNDLSRITARKIEFLPASYSAGSTCTPIKPPQGDKPLLVVKSLPGAVIDGEMKEKPKTAPLIISATAKSAVSGTIYMGYDSNNIWLYADIKDKTPETGSGKEKNILASDCLEFTLTTDPNADTVRTKFAAFDFHFAIKASGDAQTWNYTTAAPLANPVLFYTKKDGGYTLEAFIPWYNFNLGCFCRIKNKPVGFDCAINDSATKTQVRWFGGKDFATNPSQWGQALFSTEQ
ncbi:MAG: hypothetical protein LLG37_10300 [Spirochaetia bacterium]|nr:hypothetical protein [Spirochaetia bacterium]